MTGTSLIATMAAERGMDPVQFARTIRATVMPSDHTEEQFAAFMLVAHKYGLDPITKEIYAYPARKGGGINPVLSIDGWINLVNSHPQADGFDFDYGYDREGKLASCTCSMWRKDRSHPIRVTEHLVECYRNTEPWNQMPKRMLRHKAFKECARLAFGFAGIYDEDEARDVIAAVEDLQQPIDTEHARSALDAFAAEDATVIEQEHSGTVSLADRPDTAGEEGGSGSPSSLTATPTAAADLREDLIKEALLIATDDSLDEDDRIAALDGRTVIWEERVPDAEFCRQVLTTAVKVVRKQLPEQKARLYLSTLMKG